VKAARTRQKNENREKKRSQGGKCPRKKDQGQERHVEEKKDGISKTAHRKGEKAEEEHRRYVGDQKKTEADPYRFLKEKTRELQPFRGKGKERGGSEGEGALLWVIRWETSTHEREDALRHRDFPLKTNEGESRWGRRNLV